MKILQQNCTGDEGCILHTQDERDCSYCHCLHPDHPDSPQKWAQEKKLFKDCPLKKSVLQIEVKE